ncbi:MAG: branched-chain amino acid ABC transporter permease, partial [Acidimicrobiia bacterium]|nr:branched-chain amino acid ABC transporter permease [Acidimicrobiia bacterium]
MVPGGPRPRNGRAQGGHRRLRPVPQDTPRRRRRAVVVAGLLTVLAAVGLGLGAPTAAADTAPDDVLREAEPTDAVGGELVADGEPVEGVLVQVRRDGAEVGEAISDADGRWAVAVPGAGTYQVELVAETLPEGVELRDPDQNVRDSVRVSPGREQTVRFPFGDAGPVGTTSLADRAANSILNGLKFGLVVALCSIGLSLVFGTTGLVNFAHAELVTFGALGAWFFNSRTVGPTLTLVLAGVLGVAAAAVLGGSMHFLVWRPLERRRIGLVSMMIVSIGLGLLLRHVYGVVFGASPRTYTQFAAQSPWEWGPLVFPPKDLVLIPLAVVVLAGFALALQRTRLGTA